MKKSVDIPFIAFTAATGLDYLIGLSITWLIPVVFDRCKLNHNAAIREGMDLQ
jgi:hypothetical protein